MDATPVSEQSRRCRDCRRIIAGHAGNACPHCGCSVLETVAPDPASAVTAASVLPESPKPSTTSEPSTAAPAASATALDRPASTALILVLAFCTGLGGLYAVLAAAPGSVSASAAYHGMLRNLLVLVGVCTGLFLLLRRAEGDFRALFMIGFGLFIATEGVGAISRAYGLTTLAPLNVLLSLGMMVYSSLAVYAGLGEANLKNVYHRALMVAAIGFSVLGAFRFYLDMSRKISERQMNAMLAIMLGGMTLYQAVLLWRGERRRHRPAPTAAAPVPAEPAAK